MLVAPDIMKAVSQKIKWNVVGYTGYKEYAMQGPSDCFELLTSMNHLFGSHMDIHFTGNPNMLVYQIMVIHQIFKPTLQRLLRSVV